ncbi:MAG: UDP-N-acetylglucosamine 1-carboxyvinyltransferase [Candidatus Niyogibacteria bacterium RIFCSPLOWO2_12_FULL_41_13]|uniref:UDP-N-acetylglucosamine 1-carboxyvinyltransferase n=1 Tax=Candidatus Niyogibacteria bacterium RIFCSPLOWO2_12_FULL_41_13 TaxID=1801726 RepID=A0A1G2F251_9BACT|nr:MAG: UDP-N-acetylglucosamine 1-carboxyvinyltransferase [Candidatus Niyogibacteria bacterium RIFCSPLOWO2_12_FULL_41_13]
MAKFALSGKNPLQGEIEVRGSKNAVLKVFASSILFNKPILVKNAPLVSDVFKMGDLIKGLGGKIERQGERTFKIFGNKTDSFSLDKEISKHLRSSIVLLGPLLARFKKVNFVYPGGCVIGKRPIDFFLNGFSKMGAKIKENGESFAMSTKELKGAEIFFRERSVTATEALMMAAVSAKGKTILRNAAQEPEVKHLADFLADSGARIKGAGTSVIEIEGFGDKIFKGLNPREEKREFMTPSDRIEAGSFAVLGALLGKNLVIRKIIPEELSSVLACFDQIGIRYELGKNWLRISKADKIAGLNLKTEPYPGFPTDLQPIFAVLLTQAKGESLIFETVFEGRLEYINELNRMGAKIMLCDPHRIIINGPTSLKGREMESPDLRAGLAFTLSALIAEGKSVIHNIEHIDRGYEKIDERLQKIGAKIKRISQ